MRKIFTTLDKYLLTQLFQGVLFALVLFCIIWLAPEKLFKVVQYVTDHKLTVTQGFQMLWYNLPTVLLQSMPMAALFGSIFLFRRISLNSELIAMKSNGISPMRILWSAFLVGLVFSLLHFGVQELIVPKTTPALDTMYYDHGLRARPDEVFTYVEKNPDGQMDKMLIIGQTKEFSSKQKLGDFFVLYFQPTERGGVKISRILRAHQGYWDEQDKVWKLSNGLDYELDTEGVFQDPRRFSDQWVQTSRYPFQLLSYSVKNPNDMSWLNLAQYVQLLKAGEQLQEVNFYEVRLQQKLIFPLASVLFVIIGALLGTERPRSNQHYSLTFGALILFVYSILIPFSSNMAGVTPIPPIAIALLPLVGTLVLSALILLLKEKFRLA